VDLAVSRVMSKEDGGRGALSGVIFALPRDVMILGPSHLPVDIRRRINLETGDHVVTRPGLAVPSVVIDEEGARLLREFHAPCTVVDAVIRFARQSQRDPAEVLEKAFGLIQHSVRSGLLVDASGPRLRRIEPSLASGDNVAGFEVLRSTKVSDGAEVYQASSRSLLVAVKILRPGAPPTAAEMLANECRILERLDETVTPRMIARGEMAGRPYLVTEWFCGAQSSEVAGVLRRRGTVESRSELAALCHSCVAAYAGLHRQRVVHGDVHPGNLLVDALGRVRIVDFGLARFADDAQRSAGRGGIGAYFEPEYARAILAGKAGPPPTVRGEQYAIGAVVYALLSGEHYLDLSLEQHGMLRQISSEPPRPLAQWGVGWCPEIERVLARAFEKDPASRYPSAGALAEALREAADSCLMSPRSYFATTARTPSWAAEPTRCNLSGGDAMGRDLVRTLGLSGHVIRDGIKEAPTCSLSHGGAGVAYGLWQLACRWQDAAVLALADLWARRATAGSHRPHAFYSAEDGVTQSTVGNISPFHTRSGVHCVRALVGRAIGDFDSQQTAVRAFLTASEGSCSNLDLTLGWSGTLLACAILAESANDDPAMIESLRSCGDAALSRIWNELNHHVPLADGPPIRHLGVAHGWSGMAYAAMRWSRATGRPPPRAVEERLQQVAEMAEPAGRGRRWPWLIPTRGEREDKDAFMPGWCNGAAGYVHVWTLAHRTFGDERYLRLAEEAAWNAFDEPGAAIGLCCGLAGRAYGLLCLYKHTGEGNWLTRAKELGNRAAAAARHGRAFQSYLPSALECRRHSLYKGELGLAVLLADLSAPNDASMPFFEPQGSPEATSVRKPLQLDTAAGTAGAAVELSKRR
jgi:eukaryotic-like serine/threonine-protein kinase